jgi:hypothetical protein
MEGQEVLVLEGSGGVYISPGVLYLNMKRKGENLQLLQLGNQSTRVTSQSQGQ